MAELEAERKARQQGASNWREAKEFAHLLDLADFVDIPTAAEGYTGQQKAKKLNCSSGLNFSLFISCVFYLFSGYFG